MKLDFDNSPTREMISDFLKSDKKISFNIWWRSGSNEILLDYNQNEFSFSGATAIYVRDIRSETCSLFGYQVVDSPDENYDYEHHDYQGFIRVTDQYEALEVLLKITNTLARQGCTFTNGFLETDEKEKQETKSVNYTSFNTGDAKQKIVNESENKAAGMRIKRYLYPALVGVIILLIVIIAYFNS